MIIVAKRMLRMPSTVEFVTTDVHVVDALGGREHLAGVERVLEAVALGEEAELRIAGEDLLVARREGHGRVPGQRDAGHPRPLELPALDQQRRRDRQRDGRQQLVRDAEQREELVDPAERVRHARVEEVAPREHDDRARGPQARLPGDVAQRLVHVAERVLEHEAPDPRARVHRGEDEQGLEHDREVVEERLQAVTEGAWRARSRCRSRASARRPCGRRASPPRRRARRPRAHRA